MKKIKNYDYFKEQALTNKNANFIVTEEWIKEQTIKIGGETPKHLFDDSDIKVGDEIFHALLEIDNKDKNEISYNVTSIPKHSLDNIVVIDSNIHPNSEHKGMLPIIKLLEKNF